MNSPAWYALLILLFVLSLALRQGLLFFFTALLALASLASHLWMRYCLNEVTYRRKLAAARLHWREETDLTVEITNAKPLPLAWLMVLDFFPDGVTLLTRQPGQPSSSRVLTNLLALRWYERVRRSYRIRGDQRGAFRFGPADLLSGDVFGFHWRSATVPEVDELIVYPKVVPITALGLPPAWPLAEEKAAIHLVDDPLRMATVREYAPGDSMRYLHWKATARTQQLQTKVFDPGASRVIYLIVDVQTSPNPYVVVPEHEELIVSAAASVATHALTSHQAVALYTNSGIGSSSKCVSIPASRSPTQLGQIMEMLARLDPFRQLSLGHLLLRDLRNLPYGATMVVITALPEEETIKTLLILRDRQHPVTVLTVGERPTQMPSGLQVYHLGGKDAWRDLQALELG